MADTPLARTTDADPQVERLHRKQMLVAAFHLFSKFGFDEGVAGHITARDPERLDHFWVNPFGTSFGLVRVDDLILVNHLGEIVEGTGPLNTAAFAIHSQVHAARPDVIAPRPTPTRCTARHGRRSGACWIPSPRIRVPSTRTTGLRRLHRRGARHQRGQAHRLRAGRPEGSDPAQPRPADRGPLRRGSGMVVHHHGALLPGPAAGRSGRHADPDLTRSGGLTHEQVGRTWAAGSASSRCCRNS